MGGGRGRKPAELIVSLDELASICGVTPETMRSHLKQAPDGAAWMIERGRRGVGYKIAAAGAVEWWRNRRGEGSGGDERLAQLAELRMHMLGDVGGDDDGVVLTGKQRYEEYRAGQAELAFREAIGELCRVTEWENETVNAVVELRRQLQRVPAAIRKRFELPREAETAIEQAIAEQLAAFIAKLDVDVGSG